MITFNGKKFAKNANEFIDTLFEQDGTASGFYRTRKDGVLFMDLSKQAKAFVKFSSGGAFAVTATDTENGIRYMFALTTESTRFMGFDGFSYSQERAACADLQKQIENNQAAA